MNPVLFEKAVSQVRPDATWPGLIKNAAQEVFRMMVNVEVDSPAQMPEQPSGALCALVGMAGALCAVFRIRCTLETAADIAKQMTGSPSGAVNSYDALAELCNMVAGNFKAKITGLADRCFLSVPTVFKGDHYELYRVGNAYHIEICLAYKNEPVWFSLEISN